MTQSPSLTPSMEAKQPCK